MSWLNRVVIIGQSIHIPSWIHSRQTSVVIKDFSAKTQADDGTQEIFLVSIWKTVGILYPSGTQQSAESYFNHIGEIGSECIGPGFQITSQRCDLSQAYSSWRQGRTARFTKHHQGLIGKESECRSIKWSFPIDIIALIDKASVMIKDLLCKTGSLQHSKKVLLLYVGP